MLILLAKDDIALIILAVCILPIIILMVYAIIVAIRKNLVRSKEGRGDPRKRDDSQRQLFIDLFRRGEDNIEDVSLQMSRVSVTVKAMDKVKTEELKRNGSDRSFARRECREVLIRGSGPLYI